MLINEGFTPKRSKNDRLPPGQYETRDFPVLSFGPTQRIDKKDWKLKIWGLADTTEWSWDEINALPQTDIHTDIHCVTKWSKFDTNWSGVLLDEIMKQTKVKENANHLIAHSYDGYTTNVPLEDIKGLQAMVALRYEGEEIEPEHGGPVRLLVPHLYFWKSAKWLTGLEFVDHDEPGFWETKGYHNYGDPWKEQRYTFD